MKKWFLALSILIIVGLSIGTFFYQKQEPITLPEQYQPKEHKNTTPNHREQSQQESLHAIDDNTISYSLQNDTLNITYNHGKEWRKVPIDTELLFSGEYNGNKQELIPGSYILEEDRAAFLFKQDAVIVKYSCDHGKTWQDGVVTETFPVLRFRKVAFLNEQFGYVIISGDRTMSQEYSTAFLTQDGGKSWQQVTDPPTTRLLADGGFIDEKTGFLSYGTINPEQPDFYVTQDGGASWKEAVINIPKKYNKIFVQAEIPTHEGDDLSVLVNQGPNGDYEGGLVKGKFISTDNGLTWEFALEVQPNETEQ